MYVCMLMYAQRTVWSVLYTLLSIFSGRLFGRLFAAPAWVAPAMVFNNTTSLPLLLIQSLKQTQVLDAILIAGESGSKAMDRAESYFLVNAMVSNSLTFALGPTLLRPRDQDAPQSRDEYQQHGHAHAEAGAGADADADADADSGDMERGPEGIVNEHPSLLPHALVHHTNRTERSAYLKTLNWYNSLSPCSGSLSGRCKSIANHFVCQ